MIAFSFSHLRATRPNHHSPTKTRLAITGRPNFQPGAELLNVRRSLCFLYEVLIDWVQASASTPVLNRRFEDKIRHLCALAAVTKDDDAWLLLSELRILITQHIQNLRVGILGKLSGTAAFVERRQQDPSFPEIQNRAEIQNRTDQPLSES